MAGVEPDGYLIEFISIGNSVKVSALDPETGIEVSIVGPARASEAQLTQNAVRKLRYRISTLGEQQRNR